MVGRYRTVVAVLGVTLPLLLAAPTGLASSTDGSDFGDVCRQDDPSQECEGVTVTSRGVGFQVTPRRITIVCRDPAVCGSLAGPTRKVVDEYNTVRRAILELRNASGLASDPTWCQDTPVKTPDLGLFGDECMLLRELHTVFPGAAYEGPGGPGGTGVTSLDDVVPASAGTPTVSAVDAGPARETTPRPGPWTETLADGAASAPATADGAAPRLVVVALVVGAGAAVVLYRRLDRDDVLDNDLRAAIVETVRDQPGVKASDLAEALDVALTTILYHGRILDEFDVLSVERREGAVRFHDPADADPVIRRARAIIREGGTRGALLTAVRRDPGTHLAELARRIGCHPRTVKYHADRLVEDGVLVDDHDGGRRRLVTSWRVERALSEG